MIRPFFPIKFVWNDLMKTVNNLTIELIIFKNYLKDFKS